MPSDESKGNQLDAIGSLAQRQLDNTYGTLSVFPDPKPRRHGTTACRRRKCEVIFARTLSTRYRSTTPPTRRTSAGDPASSRYR